MGHARLGSPYLFCLNDSGYGASLGRGKVYRRQPDAAAEAKGFVRVIDESGEDYLYPAKRFVAVNLPLAARRSLGPAKATR